MMSPIRLALRSLASGALTSAATSGVSAALSLVSGQSAAAPINASGAVVHGEKATAHERPSLKYTVTGLAVNYAASVFWAAIYERVRHRKPASFGSALAVGALTAASAYAIDTYLVPRRLQPGFNKRLDPNKVRATYIAMALSLPIRELVNRRIPLARGPRALPRPARAARLGR